MRNAPERIWAELDMDGEEILIHNGDPDLVRLIKTGYLNEYIRADIHKAKIKELEAQLEWQPIETALDVPDIASGELVIHVWWPHKLQEHAAFDSCMRKAQWIPELKEWRIEAVSGAIAPTPTHWKPLPNPPK